jgi:hypothetical protein
MPGQDIGDWESVNVFMANFWDASEQRTFNYEFTMTLALDAA